MLEPTFNCLLQMMDRKKKLGQGINAQLCQTTLSLYRILCEQMGP